MNSTAKVLVSAGLQNNICVPTVCLLNCTLAIAVGQTSDNSEHTRLPTSDYAEWVSSSGVDTTKRRCCFPD